jgi:predicted nuclease with TOPRIM domain
MCRQPWVMLAVLLLMTTGVLAVDDKPNPEQLQKAYDDALVQLKEAQNAKNDLAKENDKLAKQIEDLKKQLSVATARIGGLERQVAENDEKTFHLRSIYAAWKAYMKLHPDLLVSWRLYLGADALAAPDSSSFEQESLTVTTPGAADRG